MSGAEVAGLVLGSIPLVISGLEHYGEGVRTMKQMWYADRKFKKLKRELGVENEIFFNSVERLLENDVEASIMADFFQHVTEANRWSHPEIDACLKRRLAGSYEVFLECAIAIADTIQDFQKLLKLDENGKGPFDVNKSSVSKVITNVRFGLSLKECDDKMSEITINNERLRRLVKSQSNIMSSQEQAHKRTRQTIATEKAREYAKTIFGIFQARLSNACRATHTASLYMKAVETSGKSRCGQDDTALRMVVHHPLSAHSSSLWSMQEAEVRLLGKVSPPISSPVRARRQVRFHPTTAQPAPSILPDPAAHLEEIQNVCERFQRAHLSQNCSELCLGYLKEHTGGSKHGLYRPKIPLVAQSSSLLTLAEILDQGNGHSLGFADRKYLAYALAMGMLRLYHTPWMSGQWGIDEVVLFKTSRGIHASHPFVSASIPALSSQLPASTSSQDKYFTSCQFIKDETIFALGVLLIEVALNKPFNQLNSKFQWNPDGSKNPLSDFLAAMNLLEEVERQAGARYGEVVRRCVLCDFGQKPSSLDDAAFRTKVEAGILPELQQEVDDLDSL